MLWASFSCQIDSVYISWACFASDASCDFWGLCWIHQITIKKLLQWLVHLDFFQIYDSLHTYWSLQPVYLLEVLVFCSCVIFSQKILNVSPMHMCWSLSYASCHGLQMLWGWQHIASSSWGAPVLHGGLPGPHLHSKSLLEAALFIAVPSL